METIGVPTVVNWFRDLFRRSVVIQAQPPLEEEQLIRAFTVNFDTLWWVAVLQLIDELERESYDAARLVIGNHALMAGEVTGADKLARLREKMIALREKGLEGKDRLIE